MIRRIQMGEISTLGWVIGVFKHAIWTESLYFLCLLLFSFSKILALSQTTLRPQQFCVVSQLLVQHKNVYFAFQRYQDKEEVGRPVRLSLQPLCRLC
jgi:hypothetical protein